MALSQAAAAFEDAVNRRIVPVLRRRGWRPRTIAFTGFGSTESVRVLARVLMARPDEQSSVTADVDADDEDLDAAQQAQRGWRSFFTAQVVHLPVTIEVGDTELRATTDRGGYLDVVVHDHGLPPGWHKATIRARAAEPVCAQVLVVGAETTVGIVSDIDDTVMVTHLPRPFIAAWNTFVRHSSARRAVPGMSQLYRDLLAEHPDAPVFYLSTGAWNVVPTLTRFLRSHGFPEGPLLMTDWGPSNTGFFRSGQEHKRTELRNLVITFPQVHWLLVGDDGQHDPLLYDELAREHADHVAAIGIRVLSPAEQLLAHGTPTELEEPVNRARAEHHVPLVRGRDGHALRKLLPHALERRLSRVTG